MGEFCYGAIAHCLLAALLTPHSVAALSALVLVGRRVVSKSGQTAPTLLWTCLMDAIAPGFSAALPPHIQPGVRVIPFHCALLCCVQRGVAPNSGIRGSGTTATPHCPSHCITLAALRRLVRLMSAFLSSFCTLRLGWSLSFRDCYAVFSFPRCKGSFASAAGTVPFG